MVEDVAARTVELRLVCMLTVSKNRAYKAHREEGAGPVRMAVAMGEDEGADPDNEGGLNANERRPVERMTDGW